MVIENEYRDLEKMLEVTDLHEKDSSGGYYTWTNNQANGVIYSRIDHVFGNLSSLKVDRHYTITQPNATNLPTSWATHNQNSVSKSLAPYLVL